jgi:hypothetical protein
MVVVTLAGKRSGSFFYENFRSCVRCFVKLLHHDPIVIGPRADGFECCGDCFLDAVPADSFKSSTNVTPIKIVLLVNRGGAVFVSKELTCFADNGSGFTDALEQFNGIDVTHFCHWGGRIQIRMESLLGEAQGQACPHLQSL